MNPASATSESEIVEVLRGLIVRAAPDPDEARPVLDCGPDAILDQVIPFSSLIVLGTVVAVEDHFQVSVTREVMERAMEGGATLQGLARMILELRS